MRRRSAGGSSASGIGWPARSEYHSTALTSAVGSGCANSDAITAGTRALSDVRSAVATGICVKIAIMSSRAALIAIVFALLTATSPGRAAAVCTAAEIISQEGGCPAGDGPCVIGGKYTIDDGCT